MAQRPLADTRKPTGRSLPGLSPTKAQAQDSRRTGSNGETTRRDTLHECGRG